MFSSLKAFRSIFSLLSPQLGELSTYLSENVQAHEDKVPYYCYLKHNRLFSVTIFIYSAYLVRYTWYIRFKREQTKFQANFCNSITHFCPCCISVCLCSSTVAGNSVFHASVWCYSFWFTSQCKKPPPGRGRNSKQQWGPTYSQPQSDQLGVRTASFSLRMNIFQIISYIISFREMDREELRWNKSVIVCLAISFRSETVSKEAVILQEVSNWFPFFTSCFRTRTEYLCSIQNSIYLSLYTRCKFLIRGSFVVLCRMGCLILQSVLEKQ